MNAADVDTSNGQRVNCSHPPQMVTRSIAPNDLPLPSLLNCYAGMEELPPPAHLRHPQRPHPELLAVE
ncbi:hypothetical protein AHAS_Ahas15G0161600 [Arachis hypogaea]